jgi:hypothetical protein
MDTTKQQGKDDMISALKAARRKILDVAYSLPGGKRAEIFLGTWSVEDLLAHLIGWDYTNIDAVKSILEGSLPYFYGYRDRDWASYNALLVSRHKQGHYAELLCSVEASHRALTDFLAAVPAEEFERDTGVRYKRYKVTIARLLQAEAEDEEEHAIQIREFAEREAASPAEGE